MNARFLIDRLRVEGADVRLGDDGLITLVPRRPLPAGLVAEVKAMRGKVVKELVEEQRVECALKEWLPLRGAPVRDKKTGRTGSLWGVHGNGVTVAFGADPILITLDPREAELVHEE